MTNLKGGGYEVRNGGITGYSSSQQLLELVTYLSREKPDIVISYSGFIDSKKVMTYEYSDIRLFGEIESNYRGELQPYYGEVITDYFELWRRNIIMMRAICNSLGIIFLSVLAPNLFITDYHDEIYNAIIKSPPYDNIYSSVNSFYERARSAFKEDAVWFMDGSNCLNANDGVFVDMVHVNEKGNQIVATAIYDRFRKLMKVESDE